MEPIAPDELAPSRSLPLGVLVLAGVRLLDAAILAIAAAAIRPIAGEAFWAAHLPSAEWAHGIEAVFVVLSVLAAIGLLLRRTWGWTGAMLLTGAGLCFAIVAYLGGAGNDLRLIVLVASAFYLNQRAVREWFWGPRT